MGERASGDSLEVGCGRGSLSSYFSDHGWTCTLLDTSQSVLEIARSIFERNGHRGAFVCGDAEDLPFRQTPFDVVSSIGLLEHFQDASRTIDEQWRVIKPGGWLFAYIVPHRPENIQRYFRWLNGLLKQSVGRFLEQKGKSPPKQEIYRNDYGSEAYLDSIRACGPDRLVVSGIYSMPMISHSPEFPFSLLPDFLERLLVCLFRFAVSLRSRMLGYHGWLIREELGQAFIIAARKPKT